MTKLSERAMLASVNIRGWSARKLDRKVTTETNKRHNASADAGRYNKLLIAKEALSEINAIAGRARVDHYKLTRPWMDDGARILSVKVFEDYVSKMRKHRSDYESAVSDFVSAYPAYVADAQNRLADMFSEADYPSATDIESRFAFSFGMMPVADANDFRAGVDQEHVEQIREEIEARTQEAVKEAQRDIWRLVAEHVAPMVEKLSTYKPATKKTKAQGIFRDSLVENIRELVKLMPRIAIVEDDTLSDLVERLQRDLCRFDAEDLRDDEHARERTARKAKKILAEVSDYLA